MCSHDHCTCLTSNYVIIKYARPITNHSVNDVGGFQRLIAVSIDTIDTFNNSINVIYKHVH